MSEERDRAASPRVSEEELERYLGRGNVDPRFDQLGMRSALDLRDARDRVRELEKTTKHLDKAVEHWHSKYNALWEAVREYCCMHPTNPKYLSAYRTMRKLSKSRKYDD